MKCMHVTHIVECISILRGCNLAYSTINIMHVCTARGLSIGERAMKGQFVVVMFCTQLQKEHTKKR